MTPALNDAGIYIESHLGLNIDLLSPDEARATLRHHVVQETSTCDAALLVVGALADALKNDKDPIHGTPTSDLLHALAAVPKAAALIWIEPGKYKPAVKVMERLHDALSQLKSLLTERSEDLVASFSTLDPLDPDQFVHDVRVHATQILNSAWFRP